MAMMPSRQFCPSTTTKTTVSIFDSFQSSICKFHGVGSLQICRYSSSLSLKPHSCIAYGSASYQNPSGKCHFTTVSNKPSSSSMNLSVGSSRRDGDRNWLDNWNKTQKHSQLKPPRIVMNYRKAGEFSRLGLSKSDNACTIDNGGCTTMEKIVEKLKKFGYMDDGNQVKDKDSEQERTIEKGSVEDIFYVEEGTLPNTSGGFSKELPLGGDNVFGSNGEVTFPWEKREIKKKEDGEGKETAQRESRFSLAEMTLPEPELRRLRNLTFQMKNKMKVGGAGVTQDVVDKIHERWKTSEIVRLKIEGSPALNMRRMHEILERKTGGLVIWRSGTSVSLYRGVSYEVPSLKLNKRIYKRNELLSPSPSSSPTTVIDNSDENIHVPQPNTETTDMEKTETESLSEVNYEDEVDKLLVGLGPRYTDWQGCNPLPVDADLLPGIVPGYQPPFRVLPYGVRATLGQKEATGLRRLARVLPPHFALGRSRQLQGIAVAMIKLWEKSSVAKIALKRGVQLTTSERMAEELKKLTGGMLLSRNKDFLVFYRGKNFLSREVAEALLEKERLAKSLQDEEERARLRASSALIVPTTEASQEPVAAGTLGETLNATVRWGKNLDDDDYVEELKHEAERMRHANIVRKLERKLAFAERRLLKAEQALCKVEEFLKPAENRADPESITDEERFMFRKLGLRMKAFLLLGRRGVFDGTVENMHLHWKYRELVKIIMKAKTFDQVKKVALALEAESGGILISVDKISKGYAIIVFRGKDYKRPSTIRPRTLLTKRKALARSIELQRREALISHISGLQTRAEQLRSEIEQIELAKEKGDEELYDKLYSAYPTSDEETDADDEQEERDDAYLETYNSENDEDEGDGKRSGSIEDRHIDTNLRLYGSQRELAESETQFDAPEASETHRHTAETTSKAEIDGSVVSSSSK